MESQDRRLGNDVLGLSTPAVTHRMIQHFSFTEIRCGGSFGCPMALWIGKPGVWLAGSSCRHVLRVRDGTEFLHDWLMSPSSMELVLYPNYRR